MTGANDVLTAATMKPLRRMALPIHEANEHVVYTDLPRLGGNLKQKVHSINDLNNEGII